MAPPPPAAPVCPACGFPLAVAGEAGGLCPRCLMADAVAHLSTVDHPALGRLDAVGRTPDVDELNRQLPQLEFEELLGRGGAGWVFRARQRSLDRPVAVKLLQSRAAAFADAVQRFEREAQLLARLKHPNIVTVYDFGATDDCPYLVMEYVAGPTLRELLRGQPLAPADAVRITRQICDAVVHAHAAGVLHRDLKPENILLESPERFEGLKVADFGISRLLVDTQAAQQTHAGQVLGTPYYAAPEQIEPGRGVDQRADVFAIGVMLYEMLTGQVPRGRFAAPSQVTGSPAALDAVVMRCLENDPQRRFPDVASLGAALATAAAQSTQRWRAAKIAVAMALVGMALGAAIIAAMSPEQKVERAERPAANGDASSPASPTTVDATPAQSVAPQPETTAPADPPPAEEAIVDSDAQPFTGPAFTISNVTARSGAGAVSVQFDCAVAPDAPPMPPGSLIWVVQTAAGRRIETPLTPPAGRREFTLSKQITLEPSDRWPLDVFIDRRDPEAALGWRRFSNVVRIPHAALPQNFGPPWLGPRPIRGNRAQRAPDLWRQQPDP